MEKERREPERLKTAARALGVLAAAAAAAALGAWALGRGELLAVLPGAPPLAPQSSALLLLCAGSLALLGGASPRTRLGRSLAAAALGGAAAAALARVFWPEAQAQPAAQSLAAFALLSAALWLSEERSRAARRAATALALACAALGMAALLGHLFDVEAAYGTPSLLPHHEMGVLTALLLAPLSAGTLALRPDEGLLATAAGGGPGGLAARRLLLGLSLLIPVVGLLAAGARMGWYQVSTAAAFIVFFGLLEALVFILRTAAQLDELDAARRRQEDKERRLREGVIAMTSHELANPLTSIRIGLSLLADDDSVSLPPRHREVVELALAASQRMSRMISDFLTLEKLASGQLPFELQELDFGVVVSQAARSMEPLAAEAGVSLDVAAAEGLVVRADADRLTQIVVNLISNAVKFSPRGGRVEVRAEPRDGAVRAAVCDEGPGIPEELRERLFERFARAKGTAAPGSGLGLSISREIAQRLGGRLGFEARAPRGTTFFFELPILRRAYEHSAEGQGAHRR